MTTHTLQIFNRSGAPKSYVVFMEPPLTSTNGGAPQVFTNAWMVFNGVTDGGFDSITFDNTVYAYWGTTPDILAPGTTVTSGGVALVDLSQQDEVAFTGASPTGFGPVTPGKAATGSFAIVSGPDFSPAAGFVFGWAKGAASPIPAPVATVLAQPNMTFEITPAQGRFYVLEGDYITGQVIDTSEDANCAVVDFTGLPQTTATVTQTADGEYAVQYN
ncbi:hypothetical protein PMI01_04366 [Caulobacter sp. AP07]|uniref:hypothetical protein n=1 Tax=Caulobacter sp. AP07 TaxID=1144304 RepID=UPI00027201D7|nr:hypothetical protein [Caulobacter sp. AP07]EJL25462.1 hypothetical protein PMI01_04366 [Caulobacter sp. AP07]